MSDSHTIVQVPEAPPPVVRREEPVHPLVQHAIHQGLSLDPATMEKLMDLQERYETRQAEKAFADAMVRLKADLPAVIAHDGEVDYKNNSGVRTHFTHATLAGVMRAIAPHLTAHGFSLSYPSQSTKNGVEVFCEITHCDGHSKRFGPATGQPDTSGGKNAIQGIASTMTYLRRHLTLLALGLATDDMNGEPEAPTERDPNRIDAEGNLRAVRAIGKAGLAVADAEAHIGRPVPEWTVKDLGAVKTWIDAQGAEG